MYNLLISAAGWHGTPTTVGRLFEYTSDSTKRKLSVGDLPDFEALKALPCLFAPELDCDPPVVRFGKITEVNDSRRTTEITYQFDDALPTLSMVEYLELQSQLRIEDWELRRSHWAVKEVDLYRTLLARSTRAPIDAGVFSLECLNRPDPHLVALMSPFADSFTPVRDVIASMANSKGMRCERADDIWENDTIIQDVIDLICRAKVVICDCTAKNPNVFYEAGVAHTAGKQVILISQSMDDIPFDLRHLRVLKYLNNTEGRQTLADGLSSRLDTLLSRSSQ